MHFLYGSRALMHKVTFLNKGHKIWVRKCSNAVLLFCFNLLFSFVFSDFSFGDQEKIPLTVFKDHPLSPEMVIVPDCGTGAFDAGVAVARTETTFSQWQACSAAGACPAITDHHNWGRKTRPLINVSWSDTQQYVKWLSHVTGQVYRLLTAEEWVCSASSGASTHYWWGDKMLSGMARCRHCDVNSKSDYGTLPVSSYPPNPYGLYDMNGNVWEWVQDCVEYTEQGKCLRRATYGGAWYYFSYQSRSRTMAPRPETEKSFTVGFRVASDRKKENH